MEVRTMSRETILFESPAEVNAKIIQNGEILLVELKFPGLQKSNVPHPEPIWEKSGFFSCFNLSRDNEPLEKGDWFKFVGDRRRCGDWITVPKDRKPSNCDLWLQIFRYRICIMLSPQNSSSATPGFGVTQYFFWNSGCLKTAINFRKSEILINDDLISLRLASSKCLWAQEDVENIGKYGGDYKSEEIFVKANKKFPELNTACDEMAFVSTSESVKEENSATVNYNNLKAESCTSIDDINGKLSMQEVISVEESPRKVFSKDSTDNNKPEKEESKPTELLERATSSTDMCLMVDASVDTNDHNLTGENQKPCHYCQSVQELLGAEEFSALQARVEALHKEDWGRVLDIIIGNNNQLKSNSPLMQNQDNKRQETLVKNIATFRSGNPQILQRRAPLRHARYLIRNSNLMH